MCSLQEHIDREARARAAAAPAAKVAFTFETIEPSPEAQAVSKAISDAVHAHALRKAADIEIHCAMGLMIGCGVRIKQYTDGSYEIAIDGTVPPREIIEEHPDQAFYGVTFEED